MKTVLPTRGRGISHIWLFSRTLFYWLIGFMLKKSIKIIWNSSFAAVLLSILININIILSVLFKIIVCVLLMYLYTLWFLFCLHLNHTYRTKILNCCDFCMSYLALLELPCFSGLIDFFCIQLNKLHCSSTDLLRDTWFKI